MKRLLLLILVVCPYVWGNVALSGSGVGSDFGDAAKVKVLYSQRCTP